LWSDGLNTDDDTNEGLILGLIESLDDDDDDDGKRDDDSDNGQDNNDE